ncbi:peptidase M3 [Caulobacter flavus]|uniref:Peptidase M3 n=1 Tax=Caulobacter flavus TaxID=1679497 RepID=A0A2N5CTZ0_9CAUL|nr:M3 family metallopeptidase [Caulobacter flavus]AYV45774.1 peptidase M3 [Caulobacter flavus]PLR15783.1 peptidase M3 [Caulobacter flavus]
MQRRTFLLTTAAAAAASAAAPGLSFAAETNPLLAPWTGPYGGVPAFDKMKVTDLTSAVDTAMARNLAEIDAIVANKAAPTFANTIAALEDTGRTLADVACYYGIWGSNMSSPEYQAIEPAIDAKFSEIGDKITQNAGLFARIEAVYNSPEKAKLTPEQQRLVWIYYTNFVRSGAKLAPAAKARVAAINTELSGLFTKFSQNLLADENTYIELTEADLAGLPDSIRASTASAAAQRKLPGKFIIVNTRSSVDPYLTSSPVRATREKVWKAFVNRGDNGGATDNNALIAKILKLRAERAKLLGYQTHAHWRLENAMAKTPDKAMALMEAVWTPAIEQVAKDVADMQAIVDAEVKANGGASFKIEPWDYRFYAEKVRKAKYDLDMNEVKPYMQLEKLREGMFWAAGQVYGFEFKKVEGVPVYDPDMTVYEVLRGGKHVGLWYFDPYARPTKRSGAWMNAYRNQERFKKPISTIVSNNSNFIKGEPGEPVLISWDDANTLFHEFGHAIHGLNSDVTYPTVSGTNVARDYVEFPSQLNEHWLSTPEVLNKFCVHYKTGKPIPQELVDKIKKASTFNQGFDTTEYLASALIDMKLHLAGDADIDPDSFERDELTKLKMPKEIVMRHRTPQFGHVFSGDGYSAGYYSYLWADTLTADVAEAFQEAPAGFYDKPTGQRLIKTIMSRGNSVDPAEQFRAFRGRDVKIGALMRDRGFPVPPGA